MNLYVYQFKGPLTRSADKGILTNFVDYECNPWVDYWDFSGIVQWKDSRGGRQTMWVQSSGLSMIIEGHSIQFRPIIENFIKHFSA